MNQKPIKKPKLGLSSTIKLNKPSSSLRRVHNFAAGPSSLPTEVTERFRDEAFDYQGRGLAIFEISHRSSIFESLLNDTLIKFKQITAQPENYKLIFLTGTTLQYAMLAWNFLNGKKGAYIDSGHWASKAITEAAKIGPVDTIVSSKDSLYNAIPKCDYNFDKNLYSYAHITSNNTIYGTQFKNLPACNIPLIVDSCSDFLSKKIEYGKFSMIYGSNQKNFGIPGCGFALIKDDLLTIEPTIGSPILRYSDYVKNNSLTNTPNTLAIFVCKLILDWIEKIGGLDEINKINQQKAKMIYDTIDQSKGFYVGHAKPEFRSLCNIVFKTNSKDLDSLFVQEAEKEQLMFLKGHKVIGGLRASIYNGVTINSAKILAEFMANFAKKHS